MSAATPGDRIVAELRALATESEIPKLRRHVGADDDVFGVRMRDLFATAEAHKGEPLSVVAELLEHPIYEPRMAAFCILDFKARRRLDDQQRAELYELYTTRHDRITTWDMVDRAAPRVVGGYLAGRDLEPLRRLAADRDPLRRRTAITAPLYFVARGSDADLTGGFEIASHLAADPAPVVTNAVGIFVKQAGTRAPDELRRFLATHGGRMPRPALRLAIEKLPPEERTEILHA